MSDYLVRSYLLRRSLLKNSSRSNREIYIQKIFKFVTGLVIKSEDLANQLHYWSVRGRPDVYSADTPEDQYLYYRQLYGEYTPFDEEMEIFSLDTQEMIRYDKNIITHPVTFNRLLSSKTYKKQLMTKYPKQERLINGILHPIHPDKSIKAKDWEIIWYDARAIEPQEILLIDSIQNYIYGFCKRWYISQFLNTEEYALGVHLANLYTSLVPKVINIRENNLHTTHAHSFHVNEYLISNGVFVDLSYLSMEQKFFLYLNFNYIKKHIGHEKTFKLMIKGLLKPENIPLVSHINTHRTNSVGELEPVFLYEDYGNDGLVVDMGVRTLEEYKALENDYRSVNGNVSAQRLEKECLASRHGYNYDKLLVSDMTDSATQIGLSFNDLAFSHLAYLSQSGHISYDVNVTLGGVLYSMTISDLFIYTLLTDSVLKGKSIEFIPYEAIVSDIIVDGDVTKEKYPSIDLPDDMWKEINDSIPNPQTIPSVPAFYDHMHFLHVTYQTLILRARAHENASIRANMLALMALVMQHISVPIFNGRDITTEWLEERGIPSPSIFTKQQLELIIAELIYSGTKTVVNENHMRLRQSATIETLMSLSSYNISCKYGMNSVDLQGTEYSHIRIISGEVGDKSSMPDVRMTNGTFITKNVLQEDSVSAYHATHHGQVVSTEDRFSFDVSTQLSTSGMIWLKTANPVPLDGLIPYHDDWYQGNIHHLNSLPQSILFKIMNT